MLVLGNWRCRAIALVAAVALTSLVGVALPARPAAAYNFTGYKWGSAPQAITYDGTQTFDSAGNGMYLTLLEESMEHIEAVTDARITFHAAPNTSVRPVGFLARFAFDKEIKVAGWWDPNTCVGNRYCPTGELWVNGYYSTDWLLRDLTVVKWLLLHELGHVIGLDHEALNTYDPFPSYCNIMYFAATPFATGQSCELQGTSWKGDDIMGAFVLYPPPEYGGGGGGGLPDLDIGQ